MSSSVVYMRDEVRIHRLTANNRLSCYEARVPKMLTSHHSLHYIQPLVLLQIIEKMVD